ncbi:MAG: hypothetical protein ACYTG0_44060 [Planctomycetota bacterium]|jgi:hypothetical protein
MRRIKGGLAVTYVAATALGLTITSGGIAEQDPTCYRITDLAEVGFVPGPMENFGINSDGEIAFTINVNGEKHAFVWLPQANYGLSEGLHDLNVLPDPDLAGPSLAHDINDAGFVVGQANGHAFAWQLGDPAGTFDLGDPTVFPRPDIIVLPTVAWALNDANPLG